MFPDQINERVNGGIGRQIAFDNFLAAIQRDFLWTATHVPIVGICHLPWAVYNAAHNADLDAFEMVRSTSDFGGCFLEVE